MRNYIFKVGDKVEWKGMFGMVIKQHDDAVPDCVLGVKFEPDGKYVTCTTDGRFYIEQKTPVLKLVEKAKTKKIVELVEYVEEISGSTQLRYALFKKEHSLGLSANKLHKTGRTITIEVEE